MAVAIARCESPVAGSLDKKALACDLDEFACRPRVHHAVSVRSEVLAHPCDGVLTAECPHDESNDRARRGQPWRRLSSLRALVKHAPGVLSDKQRERAALVPAERETASAEMSVCPV